MSVVDVPLSAQQEAILWLAWRNHQRYRTALLTRDEVMRTDTWFFRWAGRPTLYTWEVMTRVYGLQISMRTYRYVRRLNWMYWEGKNPGVTENGRHHAVYFERGLIHTFRHHLSQEHKVYASPSEQRIAAASMSRAVRALGKRGLLVPDRLIIHLTPLGAEIAQTLDKPALLMKARRLIFVNVSHSRLVNRPRQSSANTPLTKSHRGTSLTGEPA